MRLSSFCRIVFYTLLLFLSTTVCAFHRRLLKHLVQANLQQMKSKMLSVTFETNNEEETHPSVLIHWPVMTCLPASPSFYENQTNLFSKHAWQPVLENTQKWAPHKKTNKQRASGLRGRWIAKKARSRRWTGRVSWPCADTGVSTPQMCKCTSTHWLMHGTTKCVCTCRYGVLTSGSQNCTDPCPLDWLHKVWTDKSWRVWARARVSLSQQDRPQVGKPSTVSLAKRYKS